MTLGTKHIELIEAVNNAKTEQAHREAELRLQWWRDGVSDAGVRLSYIAGDKHYLALGINRPMCCGVFLDWKPE